MTDKPESDVDLMVIGGVTELRLARLLRGVGDQIGREINPHVYTRNEIARRVESNDHFLNDVLQKPRLFLIGNEHEFERLVQRGVDSTHRSSPEEIRDLFGIVDTQLADAASTSISADSRHYIANNGALKLAIPSTSSSSANYARIHENGAAIFT